MSPLAWIGQRATGALAVGGLLGILLPGLPDVLPRMLPILVFIFTVASFLKVDPSGVLKVWRRPQLPASILVWCLIVSPAILVLGVSWLELPDNLSQAITIWAVSPPMTAAIVFAVFLRLDATLAIGVSLVGVLLLPLTGPAMSMMLTQMPVDIPPLTLIARVTLFVIAAALVAGLIRRLIGTRNLARYSDDVSGAIVIILILYAAALTAGIKDEIFSHPQRALFFILLAALLNICTQIGTTLLFWNVPPLQCATAALLSGNRNMSVIYVNLGAAVTPEITLFFAAIHVPIYVFPWLLRGLYQRIGHRIA